MSGRDHDNHRIRSAHHDRLDPETADRVMSREFRTVEPRDRAEQDRHPVADPSDVANLTRHLARVAVVPRALAVACPEHEVEPGQFCTRGIRYVCPSRLGRTG